MQRAGVSPETPLGKAPHSATFYLGQPAPSRLLSYVLPLSAEWTSPHVTQDGSGSGPLPSRSLGIFPWSTAGVLWD